MHRRRMPCEHGGRDLGDGSIGPGTSRFAAKHWSYERGMNQILSSQPSERTNPANSLIWAFSLQNCETIKFYCLSHPLAVLCYSSLSKFKTLFFHSHCRSEGLETASLYFLETTVPCWNNKPCPLLFDIPHAQMCTWKSLLAIWRKYGLYIKEVAIDLGIVIFTDELMTILYNFRDK